jgi:predicted nucleic acid-binding protein
MKVLLDTGVLGLVTHPRADGGRPCVEWMRDLIAADVKFVIPQICDYELRREYVLQGSSRALTKLDDLLTVLEFACVDSPIWRAAADMWARCRREGSPLASSEALDGDVILIATTIKVARTDQTVVATTNVKHLEKFVDARQWADIGPP